MAVEWYRKAAEEGNHPEAQFHLGLMYYTDRGVSLDDEQHQEDGDEDTGTSEKEKEEVNEEQRYRRRKMRLFDIAANWYERAA